MATQTPLRPSDDIRATSARRLRTAWVLLVVALALLAYVIAPVLLLVFAGIALAVALDGMAEFAARRTPLSRGWALLAISLLIIAMIVGFGMAMAQQVAAQIGELQDRLEDFAGAAMDWLGGFGVTSELIEGNGEEELAGAAGTAVQHLARWGMTTLGALTSIVVVLVIAGFAAADPALYRRGLVRLLPPARRPQAEETLSAMAHALRWWFLGQLVSMLLLGVTVSLGLWVIGVDLWLGLGVLTAVLTFVPYLGPLIAGIPILVMGFAAGVQTGLIVTVFYLTVQNVESNIVMPWIQHKVVHLAPALAISAQVLLGLLFGLPGLILAAPLTVVAMVAVQKLWIEGALGEEA